METGRTSTVSKITKWPEKRTVRTFDKIRQMRRWDYD
nr:MAG TPA: hypothetical protein [Caudoviricetes sp.]